MGRDRIRRAAAGAARRGAVPLVYPAGDAWVEALPIGNGRLGGNDLRWRRHERMQLNEDTLYAGGPYDPANPDALEALPRVRRLIFARQIRRSPGADAEKMMGRPRQMPLPAARRPAADVSGRRRRRELPP